MGRCSPLVSSRHAKYGSISDRIGACESGRSHSKQSDRIKGEQIRLEAGNRGHDRSQGLALGPLHVGQFYSKWSLHNGRQAVQDNFLWRVADGRFQFSSLVFAGFGYNRLQVYLLQIPLGAIHGICALLSTFLCGKIPNSRCIIAATLTLVRCALPLPSALLSNRLLTFIVGQFGWQRSRPLRAQSWK